MKKEITEYYCDLCKKKIEGDDLRSVSVPVCYTSGRVCPELHDFCLNCLQKVVVCDSDGQGLKLRTPVEEPPAVPAYIVTLKISGEWDVPVSADSVYEAFEKAQKKVQDATAEACFGEPQFSGYPIFVENKNGDIVWRKDADEEHSDSQHN